MPNIEYVAPWLDGVHAVDAYDIWAALSPHAAHVPVHPLRTGRLAARRRRHARLQ
jgi:hypothetical protein